MLWGSGTEKRKLITRIVDERHVDHREAHCHDPFLKLSCRFEYGLFATDRSTFVHCHQQSRYITLEDSESGAFKQDIDGGSDTEHACPARSPGTRKGSSVVRSFSCQVLTRRVGSGQPLDVPIQTPTVGGSIGLVARAKYVSTKYLSIWEMFT